MSSKEQFEKVTVVAKANIYFDGKVVSHTLLVAVAKPAMPSMGAVILVYSRLSSAALTAA